jgi:hypothetical protein
MAKSPDTTKVVANSGGKFSEGHPRIGGRSKGTPNKLARPIKELAASYGPEAVETLIQIMRASENEGTKLAACRELLDRGYGKARQITQLEGAEGKALQIEVRFVDRS